SLLEEVGIGQVAAAIEARVQRLSQGLLAIPGVRLHSPQDAARRAGIVSFSLDGVDNATLYQQLKEAHVVCIPRGPGVRFSPHFYTERRVIDETLALVRQIAER
ncbi:MAG: aminotransferase class V-fold PLP-dependent enzyme, partial [Pseudomonas sp.]